MMKLRILLILLLTFPFIDANLYAKEAAKVMVLDFQLNDMTDLPNAPEELARIRHLTKTYKQALIKNGVNIIPANDKLTSTMGAQSPTYLFDNVEQAANLAAGSGADYLLIGVALKPTYLFVYPRILLVNIKTQKVVMAKAAQLESAWTDQNTTTRTAEKLAIVVSDALKSLAE
jgi:hypothetical protein